jgi:hypothetical protein
MPPTLNNARQDDYDDDEADWAYLDTLGDDYNPEAIIGWTVVALALAGIALILYEVMR